MTFSVARHFAVLAMTVAPVFLSAAPFPKIEPTPVDPLIKVFRDDKITSDNSNNMETARGQHATFQVVVPALPVDLKDLKCDLTGFKLEDGAALPDAQVRYVGYIGASDTAKVPGDDQLRAAPAMFPDILLEDETIDVTSGYNQSCWITVPVPVDTAPGDYKSTAILSGKIFGYETSATLPLSLKVYPATITDTRLNIVNWFQMWHRGGDLPMPKQFTEEWWDIMRLYVKDMVEHRQNWARVETLWIVKYEHDENGKLVFDFSDFDKWVQILLDAGMEKIESLQFAWRGGAWDEPFVVETHVPGEVRYQGGKTYKGTLVPADSKEADEFYAQWFPAFVAHLKEKGWVDKIVQHVGDEPVSANVESYKKAAALVRKYAPELPIMEANLSHELAGSIDIWVPVLNHLPENYDFLMERKKAGDKVWFYTCLQPTGNFANRFLEQPLIKTRLLHWINYRYGLTGYLHWGYNFWRTYPLENAADPGSLPAGDPNIVYPDPNSNGILGSIRWEAMRDGIEDHELLSQLGDEDPEAAMDFAKRLVLDFDDYNTNVKSFRNTQRELLEAVSNLNSEK